MICSISGDVATDPVVSTKSGAIFERKHIINYISTSGTDPINDEPLTEQDLVSIKSSVSTIIPPKLPTSTSIPSMLSSFQNEWDAIALEVFTLRKQLFKAKQELSAALYHHDAAVRVAANAIRERDEAKLALQQLSESIGKGEALVINNGTNNGNGNGNGNGIHHEDYDIPVQEITNARDELLKLHKTQKPSLSIKPDQQISIDLSSSCTFPFKKISHIFFNPVSKIIYLGTNTGTIASYNLNEPENQLSKYTPAKTSVSSINLVSLDDDSTTNYPIIAYKNKIIVDNNKVQFNNNHGSLISHILVHPSLKNLFITLSNDNTWSMHDVTKSPDQSLIYSSTKFDNRILSGDIHIDGALLSIGNDEGQVKIIDLTNGNLITEFEVAFKNVIHNKFALNGYWLIALSKDDDSSAINIMDLRKATITHTIEGEGRNLEGFTIDPSSSLLLTYTTENKVQLHRYIKKSKSWNTFITEFELPNDKGNIKQIQIDTDINDEAFIFNNEVKFFVITDKSSLLKFQLSYN
ncbi:Prp19/Pso4-like-domain-containing protein [Scheffersomyces amazonensis]|uniref:Prp19/Pso4-like-domain-containing protein n=1 Tax=Scheffersomyces amazonensis TaxID=1078765 RepID=UPI00315D4FC7